MTRAKEANDGLGNEPKAFEKKEEPWRPTDPENPAPDDIELPGQESINQDSQEDNDTEAAVSAVEADEEPPGVVGYDDSGTLNPSVADDPRV